MQVIPIKTDVVNPGDNLFNLIDKFATDISEKDIIAVTSKVVALCENRVVKIDPGIDKKALIKKEADYYIDDPRMSKYNILLTIKNNSLVASSGIDESNGNGYYVFWPENPDRSADMIWTHLTGTRHIKYLGIVITDSKTTPLRWGVTGFAISWCGFKPLKNYAQTPDIFGRPFIFEQTSIIDSLGATAAFVMGEGCEQTPMAIIKDAPHVEFMERPPETRERRSLKIDVENDIYSPLTNSSLWQKGDRGKS